MNMIYLAVAILSSIAIIILIALIMHSKYDLEFQAGKIKLSIKKHD